MMEEGEMVQVIKPGKDYNVIEENLDYFMQCTHCRNKVKMKPPSELLTLMKVAGGKDYHAVQAYFEHEHGDSCFSGWQLTKCALCGKKRVIGHWWSYYSTGPDYNTVWPSETLRIPMKGNSIELRICAFCVEDSEKKKKEYLEKLGKAVAALAKEK